MPPARLHNVEKYPQIFDTPDATATSKRYIDFSEMIANMPLSILKYSKIPACVQGKPRNDYLRTKPKCGIIRNFSNKNLTIAMPRRSVKTIDPNADLSATLRMVNDLPAPWNSETLFGRSAPLELEIGSGKGMFICNAAKQFPHHNFLGVEIGVKYARYSAAKLIRENLTNAVIVCGDAASVLRDSIPNGILTAVHIYFPDPWWKRAHRKRRVLRAEVLQLIESKLQLGGKLHFWTDVDEYFTSTLKLLAKTTALQGPFEVPEQAEGSEMNYRTHFERRTRLHGGKVYRTFFEKDQILEEPLS